MKITYNKSTLKKLENLFSELQYVVRYEKGSFKSGHCVLHDKRIVVINRFIDTQGRIDKLIDILLGLDVDTDILSPKLSKLYFNFLPPSIQIARVA